MGTPEPLDVRAAEEEVRKSVEWVMHMGQLMQSGCNTEGSVIVDKVLSSLSTVLTVLQMCGRAKMEDGVGDTALTVGSHCSESWGGESGVRSRGRGGPAAKKAAQRRRSRPHSRENISSTTLNDGYTWRKYGQKAIQSSSCPRSYYRCSLKYSKHCNAVRQVQPSADDPATYIITYIGYHTCNSPSSSTSHGDPPRTTEEKNQPEKGLTLPTVTANVAVPKQENHVAAAVVPGDMDDFWPEEDLLVTATSWSSEVSSSSMYNDDMKMMEVFDTSSFLNLDIAETLFSVA